MGYLKTADTTVFLVIAACVTCLKILLIPSYSSTDFEVHRNWLSIVSKLPMSKWYTESTSEWTIDYPPLFCWFEYMLSLLARVVLGKNHEIFKISSEPQFSESILIFQRFTVILSDFSYYYGAYRWLKIILSKNRLDEDEDYDDEESYEWFSHPTMISIMFLLNPGLLMVDHIHFQYNGFLTGVLLISLAEMYEENVVRSSIWFCILLNLKHLYIYLAPAYFIYIFRKYCLDRHYNFKLVMFLKVTLSVVTVFILSFGPFILNGQLTNVLKRMFPFKRGLTHAYWAPNFWSIYNFLDKVLSVILRVDKSSSPSSSSGLVQDVTHDVLPDVTPAMTFGLVAIFVTPGLVHLWKKCHFSFSGEDQNTFLRLIIICAYSSFIFGFHIHEKHLLLVMIPLTSLLMVDFNLDDAKIFLVLMVTGSYSFFPLLFKTGETPTKILILLTFLSYVFPALKSLGYFYPKDEEKEETIAILKSLPKLPLLNLLETLYAYGFIILQLYVSVIHSLIFGQTLPFLPLMFTSIYCSIGVIETFVKFYTKLLYDTHK